MMNALGITRHLRADDARRVGLIFGAAYAANRVAVDHFNVQRAGGRAIMRANGRAMFDHEKTSARTMASGGRYCKKC